MLDTLRQMAIFTRIVEAGGFSAAARQIGMAKSALSQQIMSLEQRLGVKLLNRTTRQISLTEAGHLYYQSCAKLVGEALEITDRISGMSESVSGNLRISCPIALGNDYIAPILAEFIRLYPELKIELLVDDHIVNLVEEGIDVAIRIGWPEDSTLVARKLSDSPRCLCASPNYLKRHGLPQQPEDLVKHQWVLFTLLPTPHRQVVRKNGREHTVKVNGQFKTNNALTLRSLLLADCGIGVISEFIVKRDIENGNLVKLLPDYDAGAAGVYALYPDKHFKLLKVQLLLNFLSKSIRFAD